MSAADWSIIGGTFLGGAFPWLEAIVVIPAGILAGAPAIPVLISGVLGNLLTVWLAAIFGERIRNWWVARRDAKRGPQDEAGAAKKQARSERINRVMGRWGLPGLAFLGPLGLGTQISAVAAVAMGVKARSAVIWVGIGTLLWASVAAVLTVLGVNAFVK